MKLFKNHKRLGRIAATTAAIATVMTLGWALAAYTNVLNPVFDRETAYANPPADDCIQTPGGIHVNNQNANVDVNLVPDCGVRTFVMKLWYAPSASGEPHNQQVLARQTDPVTTRVTDDPIHINISMAGFEDATCFYQVDLVDITNEPNNGYPIPAFITGGDHDCTPDDTEMACVSLNLVPGVVNPNGNRAYTLNAQAATGTASVVKYDFTFGDGTTASVPTSNLNASTVHTYAPGEWDASVSVTFQGVRGNTHVRTSPACTGHVSVTPPAKSLTCDQLQAQAGAIASNGNQQYTLHANASAQNVTISNYRFDFGDAAADQTVTTSATNASATHTYAPGEYDAQVYVTGTNGFSNVTSDACKVHITVAPPVLPAELACTSLQIVPGAKNEDGSQNFTLNAAATVANATITSYVFTFGDTSDTETVTTGATSASTSHSYAPGTWAASVTVVGADANGVVIQSTNANCMKQITVTPPECTPGVPEGSPECFKYTCDAFSVTKGDNRTVTVANFKATSNNPDANLSKVVIDWGDNSTDFEGATAIGQSHQYAADGGYTIVAVAHFTVGDQDITASGTNCAQQVSFTTTPPPVTPPTTPPTTKVLGVTHLVNTGPGSVAILAVVVAIAGTVAHRLYLGRKIAQ